MEEDLQLLNSRNAADRWQAATRLLADARSQKAEALEALGKALDDDHPFVRWCAARTLVEANSGQAVAVLLNALEKGSARQQAAAADALAYARQPHGEPLLRALNSQDASVRQSAAEALGRLGYRSAMSRLQNLLQDDSPWVRRAVIRALGHMGDGSVVSAVILRLEDTSPWVRRSAAYALGAMRARQAVSALALALSDPDPQVRRNAAWALGRIQDPVALPVLQALQKDTALDGKVAQEAQAAIQAIRRPAWRQLPGLVSRWLTRRLTNAA
jgi:HEAT repeat protein